ncbi:hypothetical protein Nepgr_021719 [Nepenthes gracilis]|uniref:Uncharacterized protein n=1 Tax=Nepenthes gracilis TaxID=150966 RepID=A0AAD3SXA0_NEPGR|nr:hypothetical protein Nepgr_021719 [Nepenthes gracilis]
MLAVWADMDMWVQPPSGVADVDEHLNAGLLFLPGSEYLNVGKRDMAGLQCPVLAANLNDVEGGLYWTPMHSSVMRLRFGASTSRSNFRQPHSIATVAGNRMKSVSPLTSPVAPSTKQCSIKDSDASWSKLNFSKVQQSQLPVASSGLTAAA